jgi:peroxiredoxin (alkyl hydroperoxide reductase subunit C)
MITIGEKFPEFNKQACISLEKGEEFTKIADDILDNDVDQWTTMFWWPKDFTFVCPTEIAAFNESFDEFRDRDCTLIGASTDSEHVHLAWRNNHEDLRYLKFPMLADTSKSLADELGILEPNERVAYRATFIIDPDGIVRWINVNDLDVGRNVDETIRVLNALQTDEMCPCNWEEGEETLTA